MKEDIVIVGAGIGGLTTALALKQIGKQVIVFESAVAIKPVGAGIVLANNAMQIFKKLGMHSKIEAAGNKVASMNITNEKLSTLSCMELGKFEQQYGVYNVAIHRADLQSILAAEVGLENIQLSKRLSKVEKSDRFSLVFEDNSTFACDVLIGADGIKSIVRNQYFERSEIRSAAQVCWRGICEVDLPSQYAHTAIEAWGSGLRFGFVKVSSSKVYWYAVADEELVKDEHVDLQELFSSFSADVLKLIAETPKAQIVFSNISDIKPNAAWHRGNACLIGDAAHATTPNLGQGACQAIEDAYTIQKLLLAGNSMADAFEKYAALRVKKVHDIVNTSWAIGKIAHLKNPVAIGFRNALMRLAPASLNAGQFNKIFDIGYV
ncbi:MAG: FAD-dependent monooxygenase [Chitinophagales bacterium]